MNTQHNLDSVPRKCPLVTHKLKQHQIDYITYTQYTNDETLHYTSDPDIMADYLADDYSTLPIQICDNSTIVSWDHLLSPSLLSRCKSQYRYSPNGLVIFLKHKDKIEHFSVATSNLNRNLSDPMPNQHEFVQMIINETKSVLLEDNSKPTFRCPSVTGKAKNATAASNNHNSRHFFMIGDQGEACLTQTEWHILRRLLKLKSYQQIATSMCISSKTVATHAAKIKEKLGAYTKSRLHRICKNNHLI